MEERYKFQADLAKGGMGQISRVEDLALGRDVAVKQILPELAEDPHFRERFCSEARAAASLEHPNIVPVHSLEVDALGRPFLTMQLIEGQDLGHFIELLANGDPKAHQQLSYIRRVEIAKTIAEALQYAHDRGLVHRDVKPDNILLGSRGQVYLTDWGVVKVGDDFEPTSEQEGFSDCAPAKTAAGAIIGTLDYLAPELLREGSAQASPASDVYSLGATMYHLFALRRPFGDKANRFEVMTALFDESPEPADARLQPVQGRVPRHLSLIIAKAMARDRESRYASCAELARDLQDYLDGEAPAVCVCTWTDNRLAGLSRMLNNRPVLFISAMLVLLALPLIELAIIVALW